MTTKIEDILEERGERYGSFQDNSQIMQDLKDRVRNTPNWSKLQSDQKEAIDMTLHKLGRILGGQPNYIDSWQDIIGYNQLIVNRLVDGFSDCF